jgi:hypothetical protein
VGKSNGKNKRSAESKKIMIKIFIKETIVRVWPLVILTVVVLVFLGKGLTSDAVFFGADEIGSDLLHGVYAQREYFATDFLKKGGLPLWIPFLGSGIPAESQMGFYVPLVVILYSLFTPALAFNLIIISNFLLVALGIYLYAQKIGLNKIPALFSALVFTLSGFMIGHLRHVSLESTLVVLPYLLLIVEKIITQKRFLWMVILAFLVFLTISPGHLPTSYFIFVFVLI